MNYGLAAITVRIFLLDHSRPITWLALLDDRGTITIAVTIVRFTNRYASSDRAYANTNIIVVGILACQLVTIHFEISSVQPVLLWKRFAKIVGKVMIEIAKMIGMTPAALTLSGKKLRRPCDAIPVRTLSTRCADCTGTLR